MRCQSATGSQCFPQPKWARDSRPALQGSGGWGRLVGTKPVCSVLATYLWLVPVTLPMLGK